MRTNSVIMVAVLLLASRGAAAQDASATTQAKPAAVKTEEQSRSDVPLVNEVDFGFRGTVFGSGSDQARFQRYRDVRDGGTVDRFRFFKDTSEYKVAVQADHIGYRDQRFSGSYTNFGKVKASFEWNQIPLFYSQETRTLYDRSNPGTLKLNDSVQSGIQDKTLTLANALTAASAFDLRTRRDIANANVVYSATPNVDLTFKLTNINKRGAYPWGGSFGIGGAIATEMPVPVDHRTTDVGTSLEYANDRAYARLGYDGSFFRNDVPTLVWDNPSRVTDAAVGGPAQGRMSLWPNTDMNTVSAAGGVKLPGRSRASAFVSIANMSNNATLLPFTINSALVSPALDRPTADITARVTAMNYLFTSRPVNTVWFSARYRQYQFDNRTEPFFVGNGINYDTTPVALNIETEPFSQTRHTFDADATYAPWRHVGFRAGYAREEVDRTHRVVENTTEDIGRASVDLTGFPWLTVRGVFEHSKRRGSAVDEHELLLIGEQPKIRHYDISDRDQDRFSTIVMFAPLSMFSVNTTVSFGRQEYPGTTFGLRNNDNHVYSVGFDFVPADQVSMGLTYGFEHYTALQASRTATPLTARTEAALNDPTQQFNDPRRDWTDDSADRVHTIDASVDLLKVIPRTDIRAAYDYSRAQSTYTYGLAPNTVITAPVQLAPVINELQRATVDGRYFVTRHLALGAVYWLDKYKVDDFALSPVSSLAQPATATPALMMLGYFYRPYTANSLMGKLTYLW
jgi:MtrB/PioB family decaheme-associated outer membrane protein